MYFAKNIWDRVSQRQSALRRLGEFKTKENINEDDDKDEPKKMKNGLKP